GVFRQEPVPGMDRFGACGFGRADDRCDMQVVFDAQRVVGALHMQRVAVDIGVDRDAADAEPATRADDAAGDLAAVGDQDGAEHCGAYSCPPPRRVRAWARISETPNNSSRMPMTISVPIRTRIALLSATISPYPAVESVTREKYRLSGKVMSRTTPFIWKCGSDDSTSMMR